MNNRNLIVTLAVVALLTVAATTAGCATNTTPSPTPIPATTTSSGNNTTFSSGAGFNITYPKNLTTDSSTNASIPQRLYIHMNPNSKFEGIVVAANPRPGSTLADFVNESREVLKSNATLNNYKNFTMQNDTNTTFAGKPAQTFVWSGIIPVSFSPTNTTNMSVKAIQTMVVNNNVGYTITYKATPDNYDTYLPLAQRIMNSFVLT